MRFKKVRCLRASCSNFWAASDDEIIPFNRSMRTFSASSRSSLNRRDWSDLGGASGTDLSTDAAIVPLLQKQFLDVIYERFASYDDRISTISIERVGMDTVN